MPAVAARLNNLPTYIFASLGERIRSMTQQGLDVIRLDIGSPDYPPPDIVIEALHQSALNFSNHSYSGYTGLPAFRQAVARYYQRRFGVLVDPDREVLPLLGSKEGLVNFALAYLDTGDITLIPDISYPSYSQAARLTGAEICWLPLRRENGYLPDFDLVPDEIAQRAKLLWLNYPNNPTGAVADLNFYHRAVEFCAQHDIILISDNPYVEITFDNYVAPSALEIEGAKECTVEFMSLSKSHNMAGWRLGAAVGNADMVRNLLQIKSNIDSGHFKPIYEAGVVALDQTPTEWQAERNNRYAKRRDRIMSVLPDIGLEADTPQATIYVWAKVSDGSTGAEYAQSALDNAYVSLAPGGAYGPGGDYFVRISLGTPDDRLEEALERLKLWYASK